MLPFSESHLSKMGFDEVSKALRTVAAVLRLSAALLSLSWCLPLALRLLRSLSAFLASPAFFFLLCNAIILTLLANSGFLSRHLSASNLSLPQDPDPPIVYQDKEMMITHIPVTVGPTAETGILETEVELKSDKIFRRTKSEIEFPEKSETKCVVLRRSETEMCRKMVSPGGGEESPEEMSNEEFHKKIEEFIAKQLKFRRQESKAGGLEISS